MPGGGIIFQNRDAISYLGTDGAFVMPIPYTDLALTGAARMEKRLLTLRVVQTNGKRRLQAIKFSIENIPGAG